MGEVPAEATTPARVCHANGVLSSASTPLDEVQDHDKLRRLCKLYQLEAEDIETRYQLQVCLSLCGSVCVSVCVGGDVAFLQCLMQSRGIPVVSFFPPFPPPFRVCRWVF